MPSFPVYAKLGGLSLDPSGRTLEPNACTVANNLIVSSGNISLRPGRTMISQNFGLLGELIGMTPYYPNDGGPKSLIIIRTDGIFAYRG